MSLFGIGQNECGILGLNHENNVLKITKISKNANMKNINIKCGYQYNIYFKNQTQIFCSSGYNKDGECGIGNFHETIKKLTPISYFKRNKIKIRKVCTSIAGRTTFWISNTHQLYGNGKNEHRELGIGHTRNVNEPVLIECLSNVIDASSAWDYSIALCNTETLDIDKIITYLYRIEYPNKLNLIPNDIINLMEIFYGGITAVYSTTWNTDYGGNGDDPYYTPSVDECKWREIKMFQDKNIIKVKTGGEHSLFLASNGDLFSCGSTKFGQLGIGSIRGSYSRKPIQIRYFQTNSIKIKDIACGFNHNLAVDYNYKLYVWGHNAWGQCGCDNKNKIIIPTIIDMFKDIKIREIRCGANHSYVCTNDFKRYLFGKNNYNQCIKNTMSDVKTPYLITKKKQKKEIKDVFLCYNSTILLVDKK